jgi:hypothetical protein
MDGHERKIVVSQGLCDLQTTILGVARGISTVSSDMTLEEIRQELSWNNRRKPFNRFDLQDL